MICSTFEHIELLEQGLHNEPQRLQRELQEAIDRVEADHPEAQVIVLGYGLCSRGTEGLYTRRCRLVAARAHDCITLLLGDKQRYAQYVKDNPGTYWYSPGWNRHGKPPGKERYERIYKQYLEQYGQDNADYLMQTEQHWFNTYNRATYVSLTVNGHDQDLAYTQSCADWLGWEFDHQQDDPSLLLTLLTGPWDQQRFVVLERGQTYQITGDDRVIEISEDTT